MQELHGAIDEVNDFYLEKHGRVAAATVQVAEDQRVRLDKAKQDRQKNLALETILCHLRAEGDTRMRKLFFDLFRQRYLSVKREIEQVRQGKERTRFPVENYCPDVGKGRSGPSGESSRVSERSGSIYSALTTFPSALQHRVHARTPRRPLPLRPRPYLGHRSQLVRTTQTRTQPHFTIRLSG